MATKPIDPAVDTFLKAAPAADAVRASKELNAMYQAVQRQLADLSQQVKTLALTDDQVDGLHSNIKAALDRKALIEAQATKLEVTLA